MKAAQIILVLLIIGGLIGWVRHGQDLGHIARSLPFCGGHKPGAYDLGGLALLGLCLWGLSRLKNAGKSEDAEEEASLPEAQEAPEPEEEPAPTPETPDDKANDESEQSAP